MPWTPEEYRRKHNKKLTLSQADHARRMAEAMIAHGVPEGEAIATANARVHDKSGPHGLTSMAAKRKSRR